MATALTMAILTHPVHALLLVVLLVHVVRATRSQLRRDTDPQKMPTPRRAA